MRVPNRVLTMEELREANLRENKNLGDWDYDMLANYDEKMLVDVGFSREELDDVFGLNIDEDFDVDKELEEAIKRGSKRVSKGDVWRLGNHKLIIGDSTDREVWINCLGREHFDFMFTDPPYKIAYTKNRFKGYMKTKKGVGFRGQRKYPGVESRGSVPEYNEWLSLAARYQNPKGANVMIFENWRNTVELWQAVQEYWKIKNIIIWWLPNRHQGFSRKYLFYNKYDIAVLGDKKEVPLNEEYEEELDNYLKEKGQKFLDSYEIVLYGQKGASYFDRRKRTQWSKITDHISWAEEQSGKPGIEKIIFGKKPIKLLVPYIKILSPRGGIIAEPFCGSGSTIIACEIMKRRCRAIEIEPIYGEVILLRWEKFTGKKAVKISK